MIMTLSTFQRMARTSALIGAYVACVSASPAFAQKAPYYLDSGGNSGSGGGGGGSGSSGSGSSGSGTWGSGSSGSGSGSWGSSNSGSGSGSSGSGDVYRGSGDNSGSGSSNSGSGSSNSGSGSSNSGSGSSNSGSGSSNSGGGDSYDESRSWQRLAERENPDFDSRGFPTRRGEIVSLDLTDDQIKSAKRRGFSVVDKVKLPALGLLMVRLRAPRGMTASQAMQTLRAEDPETFFELDHYFGVTGGGLDGKAGDAMLDMKVPGPSRFTIGMIDTAVWRQATLRSARVDAKDFANRSGKPPYAHGTAVASILYRQGAVRIVSANVFSADGRPYSSAESIARAVNWMVERKVPVINISIAGPRNALVDKVIAAATARGHIIVAAAGNGGPNAPAAYPAASPGAVAVTAIDRTGKVYLNANRGAYIDMSAIGVGIGAEAPDGTLRPHSGTSFAAPFVSASLARCQASTKPRNGQNCISLMEKRARDLGAPGRDPIYGYGLLVP
jgi:Subtilase family